MGKKNTIITVVAGIESEDLIECIHDCISHDDIPKFIMTLEKRYQEWGVTERLAGYFISEMSLLATEDSEFNFDDFVKKNRQDKK